MSAAVAAPDNTFMGQAKYRTQPLGRIPWADNGGSPVTLDLRNVGYLHRLRVNVNISGQYATAGPTGQDGMNQYVGPVGRIAVRSNSVGVLFDTTGFAAAIISAITAQYDRGNAVLNPTPYTFTASPGTAAFANKWVFEIPISLYLANYEAPLGLFQTAVQGQETLCEIRWTKIALDSATIGSTVYSGNTVNAGSLAGYASLQQVYFEPINQQYQGALPNGAYVHQWNDTQYPVTADGDTDLKLPSTNYIMRIILIYVQGATAPTLALNTAAVTRIRIQYGANVNPIDYDIDQIRYDMARNYPGIIFPNGVFIIDLLSETSTERDWLNSAAATELRVTFSTSGGSYAGGAYVRMVREMLIPYILPTPGSVGVQGVN